MVDKTQRIDQLRKMVEDEEERGSKYRHTIRIRNETRHLPVISVDQSFLRYNLKSGRTRSRQIQYLKENDILPNGLFDDPEDDEAQKAQHEILLELIGDKDLIGDLEREGQLQPAIITYDGYVVNGNRRLAALRSKGVQHVMCVVLPSSCNPKELYEIELKLQMAADTKSPYNWVDELLYISYGLNVVEEDEKIIAKTMKISTRQIKAKVNTLILINMYLDWIKQPEAYYVIYSHEEAFRVLDKFVRQLKDTKDQKMAIEQAFAIIKNPPEEERIYIHLRKLFRNFEKIQKRLASTVTPPKEVKQPEEKEPDKQIPPKKEPDEKQDPDPLKALADVKLAHSEKDTADTSSLFSNPDSAKEHLTTLLHTIEDVEAETKELKDKKATFKTISDVHRKLQGILISSETLELEAIERKLKEIIRLSSEIISRVNDQWRKKHAK